MANVLSSLRLAGAIAIVLLAGTGAMAQSPGAIPMPPSDVPAPGTSTAPSITPPAVTPVPMQRRAGADQEYTECLKIWDKGTHMTRAQWAATCRRVQNRLDTVTGQAEVNPGRQRVR